jgi:hypothetical protein
MKHIAIVTAAGIALNTALSSTPASAAFLRTFVSGLGSDSNPCTHAQPCLTFEFAITQTVAGGEIDVLDSGGYGPVTIDKAISIVNDGVGTAGIRTLSSSGTAITINAGPNDAVSLRGLTIDGVGTGVTGIAFNTGQSLTIENSVIRHFTFVGIHFAPNATSNLAVLSTRVADNASSGVIVIPSGSGAVTAVFNHVEVSNNAGNGIDVQGQGSTGTVNIAVSDSEAVSNGLTGFFSNSFAGKAPTTLMMFRSVAANNGTGIQAFGTGATLRAAQSMVTGNTSGWQATSSGVVQSYGDNYIDGNGSNEAAPPSVVPGKK